MQVRVRNSLEFWKSTPTTAAVLFGIEMPYRPPKSPLGAFLWRQRVWLETTAGLSLLEPWEKVLIRKRPPVPRLRLEVFQSSDPLS